MIRKDRQTLQGKLVGPSLTIKGAHDRQNQAQFHLSLSPSLQRVGGERGYVSAAVSAAVERMFEDEQAREVVLDAVADEIRRRDATPHSDFVDHGEIFAPALRNPDRDG